MTSTNLFIAASFASSGDFPQVSRDISERLEVASILHKKKKKSTGGESECLLSEYLADDDDGGMEELEFLPRFEEDDDDDDGASVLFAPRLQALSPSSSFDTSPGSSPVKSRSDRSVASSTTSKSISRAATEDMLATAFSNIQLVSPTYFQLRQVADLHRKNVVSPEELHAMGDYNYDAPAAGTAGLGGRPPPSSTRSQATSTRTSTAFTFASPALNASTVSSSSSTTTTSSPTKSFRNSLSDMVHSVDLTLFPKPLQRLAAAGSSPVMARIGSVLSGTSSYASARHSQSGTTVVTSAAGTGNISSSGSCSRCDDSFHTAHMTEAAMTPSPQQKHQSSSSPPPPTMVVSGPSHLTGISPIRKRHHDGTLAVDAQAANHQASSERANLLSPEDIPPSTRSKTASSFAANRHAHRIIYRLKDGTRGMSQRSKEAFTSYLPRLFNLGKKKPDAAPSTATATSKPPRSSPHSKNKKKGPTSVRERNPLPEKVYVLLLEMSNKLFEIVPIDLMCDTTVGCVLAKVRTAATDPVLATQKYTALLSSTIEFSAPMLPLGLLLDRNDKKPLLTALPPGAGPDECRRITTVLMGHPTLQRFWANEDPFEPSPAKKQRRS